MLPREGEFFSDPLFVKDVPVQTLQPGGNEMRDPVITTEKLTRFFPSGVAVDNLTLSLPRGEVLALLGPNGAGKTTTVRLLNGVLKPDSGRATVLGLDVATQGHEIRKRTGVLTENAGLDDRLTARENLLVACRLRGWKGSAAVRVVDEHLERFGMASRGDDLTQGFSTGQRKRVALARALLGDPEILFLDEPTAGLDPTATRDVAQLIKRLTDGHGRTVILATHFLGEAGVLADTMAVMHLGRLVAFGRPDELAAELWDSIATTIDLGGPADPTLMAVLAEVDGVVSVSGTPDGAEIRVRGREVLPQVTRVLTDRSVAVYGIQAKPPDLEDVYYEIEARARQADEASGRHTSVGVDVR